MPDDPAFAALRADPFAPPDSEGDARAASFEHDFYVVGEWKFVVMTVVTLNQFLVYWFYRNWRAVSQRTGQPLWPVVRGLCWVFFTHSLLHAVRNHLRAAGRDHDWQPNLIVARAMIWQVALGVSEGVVTLLLVPLGAAALVPAQRAINVACGDPNGASNADFTWANGVWAAAGALFWLLFLWASLFPDL